METKARGQDKKKRKKKGRRGLKKNLAYLKKNKRSSPLRSGPEKLEFTTVKHSSISVAKLTSAGMVFLSLVSRFQAHLLLPAQFSGCRYLHLSSKVLILLGFIYIVLFGGGGGEGEGCTCGVYSSTEK